uniref:LRRCT domain-containing protein n=1 Tax=Branchiostoma floridae TaxID=7739 RepID=C3Z8V5_BRAFL|eukprot:XP_002595043.1 hypothetical protein BRAFLDRAFT_99699 [Branchiostoma floridae]
MPLLTNLDLCRNKLKEFQWSVLRNTTNLTRLALDHNEISSVDDYVDFPPSLTRISLNNNHIATFPETFLNGAKPPQNMFYFEIWQNWFRCEREIHWIARLRQCVRTHRKDGCVNTTPDVVKTCMIANCNFHPSGVVVILDMLRKSGHICILRQHMRCKSPKESLGKFLKDIQVPARGALASPPRMVNSTSLYPGTQVDRKKTERPTPTAYIWDRTTASYHKESFAIAWKTPVSAVLGFMLAILLVFCAVQCVKRCKKRRQAVLDNMVTAPPLSTVSGMRVSTIISNVGLHNDDLINLGQQGSASGNNGHRRRSSSQHVYEEIKDEDIQKMRRSFQSERRAYSGDEILHLDVGKLYGQDRLTRNRDMVSNDRNRGETSYQSRPRRQTRHSRHPGFKDITMYEMASSGTAGHNLRPTSVPCTGVLYRSGRTPSLKSRRRRNLKKEEPTIIILSSILAGLSVAGVIKTIKLCRKRRQAVLNKMAAAPPLRTVSLMRVPNITSVNQTADVINPLQHSSHGSSDDWSMIPSIDNTYEEIKDEDVMKTGQSFQSDRSAYFRREIRHLDADKLYNLHRIIRERECNVGRTNRFTSKDEGELDQLRLKRLARHRRRYGLDTLDANLYKMTSSGATGRRARRSASLGILYRSGRPQPIVSRHRQCLKEGSQKESIEMSVRRRCSLPTTDKDCPPPIPKRERRNDRPSVV